MKKCLIICLFFFPLFIKAKEERYNSPKTVVMIRHGEKQLKTDSVGNIIYDEKNQPEFTDYLSVKGWQRAGALSYFFTLNENYTCFGRPVAIFAGKQVPKHPSARPIDTIKPLASLLHMQVLHPYSDPEYKNLVNLIMNSNKYKGQFVIICFEHQHIPLMAECFGVTNAPKTWDEDVFDRAWVIQFDKNGKVSSFENRPQSLMFGDSEK